MIHGKDIRWLDVKFSLFIPNVSFDSQSLFVRTAQKYVERFGHGAIVWTKCGFVKSLDKLIPGIMHLSYTVAHTGRRLKQMRKQPMLFPSGFDNGALALARAAPADYDDGNGRPSALGAAASSRGGQQLTVAPGAVTGAASGAPGAPVAMEPLSLAAAARAAILAICNAVPAAQLWYQGSIPLSLPTSDGFYGCTRDTVFLALEDLATSNVGPEVLSVDAADDPPLAALITSASALLQTHAKKGATPAALASTLATYVCQQMGGAVEYLEYEYYTEPEEQLAALRARSGTRVVPLGEVKAGATRHRALLFKVLCDKLGLQASYDMGACVRGAHAHHAWNTMILNRKVVLVDVVHAPGTLYPLDSDAARRYKRIDEFAFASLQSTFIKRTEPLPAGTAVDATSAKQYYDGLFGDAVPPPPKCKA